MNATAKTLIIALVLIVAGAGLYFFTRSYNVSRQNGPDQQSITPIERDINSPTQQEDPEISSWEIYTNEEMGFSIKHPADINVQTTSDGQILLSKWGPTQEPNTEFYDGISLAIQSFPIEGDQMLAEIANEKAVSTDIIDVVEETHPIEVNEIKGVTYTVEGLGIHKYILLPFHTQSQYLQIINSTVDPTEQGFNETVSKMLSTLELEPNQRTTTNSIFLVALEDKGRKGRQIGCEDSLVGVPSQTTHEGPLAEKIKTLYEELFSIGTQTYGENAYYNALYQSDLSVEEITVENENDVEVRLSGEYAMGGVCDIPRFKEQLREIALQFPEIDSVKILIDGKGLEEITSQR